MNFLRRWLLPVALLATLGLAGCYMPKPVTHATLKVSAQGAFEFKDQEVAAAELSRRIGEALPSQGDLVVQIEIDPGANVAALRTAVAAVTAAHARVAFAGSDPAR